MGSHFSHNNIEEVQTLDLEGFAKLISLNKINNIITMVGAGISTAAGIPDFRSPSTGIYDNLEEYNLPYPMAVFDLQFFNENPKPFFEVARRLYNPYAKPTLSHYFITLLNQKGLLRRHYTQNVDRLERIAGLPEEKLIEAHGTFNTGHCQKCTQEHDFDFLKREISEHRVPKCVTKSCDGTVKPDVVLFGEGLPSRFTQSISPDFSKCDMLIIMGTSLTVMPFCGIINCTRSGVPRLLINKENVGSGASGIIGWAMKWMVAGLRSKPWKGDDPNNTTDLFVPGNADDTVLRFVKLLGWEDELLNLQRTRNEELEKEFNQQRASGAA